MPSSTFPKPAIIVAMDCHNGIGFHNTLPWHLPEDLAHFKRTTLGYPVIMGRKTFESIGGPLPGRRNLVLTTQASWQAPGVEKAGSLAEALELTKHHQAFIIGGGRVYDAALPLVERLIVTTIDHAFQCDAFFPAINPLHWEQISQESHYSIKNGWSFAFITYEKANL